MGRLLAFTLLTLFCVQDTGRQTILLKDGRTLSGTVVETGTEVRVTTSLDTHTYPAEDVVAVFQNAAQLRTMAKDRMKIAKNLYQEARDLKHEDPAHNEKLKVSIVLLQTIRDIYAALGKHYGEDTGSDVRKAMQLMRMARSDMGSERSNTGSAPESADQVPLADIDYKFEPPEIKDLRKRNDGAFGGGQKFLAKSLGEGNGDAREKAAWRVASPPSPAARDALLDRLQKEGNDKVLKAVAYGLRHFPADDMIEALGWFEKERKRDRAWSVIWVLRARAGEKTLEWLMDLYVRGAPPEMEPALVSIFREYRPWASKSFTKALGKNKEKKKQSRIIKMMGLLREPDFCKTLVKAMRNYPVECFVALETIGPEAVPSIMFGAANNPDQNVRKYCTRLLQKITGLNKFNMNHFQSWYRKEKKNIKEAEEAFWADQERKFYPVDKDIFRRYNKNLRDLLR